MWLTVTADDGTVLHTAHIPDEGVQGMPGRPNPVWRDEAHVFMDNRAGDYTVAKHPVRPTDHDVVPTSPPVSTIRPSTLYGAVPSPTEAPRGGTTFAWSPLATEVLPAVAPCPGVHYAFDSDAGPCPEVGPHTHYVDGSVHSS